MEWVFLLLAILFEIAGTTMLKLSNGFSKLLPSIAMVIFYALSFGTLSLTLKRIDVGVAYAVWSALGTALIATIGVLWFHEPVTALKIISIVAIIGGVVGLYLSGGVH
ncbi:MAG TPA: multidrug efflux SMR transporter [Ktedonobacterales bacterium]|jgi:small multidrug resistance pump